MSWNLTWIGVKVQLEPAVAKGLLIAALKRHDGDVKATAKSFGVTRQTLHSWIRRLEIAR